MNFQKALDTLISALGWVFLLNMIFLLWWFLWFIFGHDFVYKFHSQWFTISEDDFDSIHYALMGIYKITMMIGVLTPYLALKIVKSKLQKQ